MRNLFVSLPLLALAACTGAMPPPDACQPDQEFRFDGCISRGGVTDPFVSMPSPPEPEPQAEPPKL